MTCASRETLEQLLAGGLGADEAEPLRQHLGGCPRCQEAMDRLSDVPELRDLAAGADRLTPPPLDTPGLDLLLANLRETPAVAAAPEGRDQESLGFLGPPEQEGDLGTLGPYRVLAKLGHGGMGIVLKAFDKELARPVALKVLRWERTDDKARARFVREARAAAGLNHDHVVPVHGVVNPPDAPPYLVMPFVPGPTLRDRIVAERGLDPRAAATIAAETADGLSAAHAAGLIHRDIKPANIILDTGVRSQESGIRSQGSGVRNQASGVSGQESAVKQTADPLTLDSCLLTPGYGRARIMDFGLVRVKEQSGGTTQEGTIPGTPEYMSPEQIRTPNHIDERSDIYSLGVTLYESLTGAVPFRGAPHMVLQQVLHDEPLAPRRLSDRIPRDLETICLKAMAKEPARRYATAADLRDDLRRWLAGEPIAARPVGRLEKAWRWCRRRPREAALSAVVLGLLMLSLAGVLWYQNERGARIAERALKMAEVEGDVGAALREAETLLQRSETRRDEPGRTQLLLEAFSALQRAEGVLAASKGLAPAELTVLVDNQRRVLDQALADQRFIAQLQEIRSWRADDVTGNNQDFPGADRRYAAAFKAHGLQVHRESLAQVATLLGSKNQQVRHSLAVALDDWAYMRRQTAGDAQVVLDLAKLIDADPMRNRIRAAQEKETPQALGELQGLAQSPEALELPPSTVHLLAMALFYRGDNEGPVTLLRAAQRRYPDDFQINHDLGWIYLFRFQPPQTDHAVRFFGVALALRPQSTGARVGLANAFRLKRDFAEATIILSELIRHQPGSAPAHISLGHLLGERGEYAQAAVAFGKAIELQPDEPYPWYIQAAAYVAAGDLAAYRKTCTAMLERFGSTKDPWVAGRILYACVQGPDAVPDPSRLFALVDIAQSDRYGGDRIHGAVLHRAGKHADAIPRMTKGSLERAWDWFLLSMALHRQGQTVEANRHFDKARLWLAKSYTHWSERAEGLAMMREAETLLRGKEPKGAK